MSCLLHYLKGKAALVFLSFLFFGMFAFTSTEVFAQSTSVQDELVNLINQERGKNNLSTYNKSDKLLQAALTHNQTMYDCSKQFGINPCFAHQVAQLNEANLITRINATGYNPQTVGENIGWGQTSASQIFNAWMGSSGHKANILNVNFRDIGCSLLNTANGNYSGMYWTCDFGKSYSSQPTNTPTSTPTPSPTIRPSANPSTQPSSSPSLKPSASPTTSPTTSPLPSSSPFFTTKPWWCIYVPNYRYCI